MRWEGETGGPNAAACCIITEEHVCALMGPCRSLTVSPLPPRTASPQGPVGSCRDTHDRGKGGPCLPRLPRAWVGAGGV